MKKFSLILIAASFCLIACEKSPSDTSVENTDKQQNQDTISQLLASRGDIDYTDLEAKFASHVLQMEYYRLEDDPMGIKTERQILTKFGDDGKCQAVRKITHIDRIEGEDGEDLSELYDGYYYGRECDWKFDAETSTLTTTDKYGKTFVAKVVYYDGEQLIYEGMIGDEFHADNIKRPDYITLSTFVEANDTWNEWKEQAVSYDSVVNSIVADDDNRFNTMIELCGKADGNIDDELFVNTLLGKVFYFGYDKTGTESGCFYGDVGVYCYEDDIWYWFMQFEGGHYPGTYVMMEDGKCRDCYTFVNGTASPELDKLDGTPVYNELVWSYDKDTNILHTGNASEAEVLYFDGNIAILRGVVNDFPYCSGDNVYGLFYVDFTKLDREEVLKSYDMNIADF